jgi:hypothetical protein
MKSVLFKYSLPSMFDLLADPPSKPEWKAACQVAVVEAAKEEIEEELLKKSTLSYLNPVYKFKKCHTALHVTNPRQVTRANIKVRMLTGCYTLQASKLTFKKSLDDTCPLCRTEPEDIRHMLTRCSKLATERNNYITAINGIIPSLCAHKQKILQDNTLFTHLILDPRHPDLLQWMHVTEELYTLLENITRDMCFALHLRRARILST